MVQNKPNKKRSKTKEFIINYFMGGVSLAISQTFSSPIEIVQMNLKNQDEMIKKGYLKVRYTGILDCVRRVHSEEGWKAFWRGNLTNVIIYFLSDAWSFALKDYFKNFLAYDKKKVGYWKWFYGNFASGGASGAIYILFKYPIDKAKIRLMNDKRNARISGRQKQFSGILDVWKQSLKNEGILSLYKGFAKPFVVRVIYNGFYFGLFDTMTPSLPKIIRQNFFVNFACGWIVATFSNLVVHFIIFIEEILNAMNKRMTSTRFWDCLLVTIKTESGGILFFLKGAQARTYRFREFTAGGVLAIYNQLQIIVFGKTMID